MWPQMILPLLELSVGLFLMLGTKETPPRGGPLYIGVLFLIWGDRDMRAAIAAVFH